MQESAVRKTVRTRVSRAVAMVQQRSRRFRRLSRLARRASEAPPRFVAYKLFMGLQRPLWVSAYRLNATGLGHRILHDLTPRQRQSPSDLQPHRKWARLGPAMAITHPDHMRALVAKADRALEHRIPCLGFGEIDLGASIDWHRDYVGEASWPRIASLRIDFVRENEECDVKVPWEISRLQWLVWLGQAWSMTDDSRYVNEFTDILDDWWRNNPVGVGVAWSCPMEAAIRGINVIAALELFWPALNEEYRSLGLHLLSTHASFLRRHPELSDVNGNHYLADLAGVVQLGLAMKTPGDTPYWLKGAIARFEREVVTQVHDDGVHHEHATGYHRLVTELVISTVAYLRASGQGIRPILESSTQTMLEFLSNIAGTSGHIPLIGDSDSGQVVIFGDRHPNDAGALLALGALLFDRPDLFEAIGSLPAEALWHLGADGTQILKGRRSTRSQRQSRLFPDGGYGTLLAGESVVVTRFGSPGLRGRAAHDHDDLTSFTAELCGAPVIIDTGSSTYTGSKARRRTEISQAAHNLFTVGCLPATSNLEMGSVMDVARVIAKAHIVEFDPSPSRPTIVMSHNAFDNIDGIQGYSRRILLSESGARLECIDQVTGEGVHNIQATFHLAATWREVKRTDHVLCFSSDGGDELWIGPSELWDVNVERVFTAPLYGCREPSLRLRLAAEVPLPVRVATYFEVTPSNRKPGARSRTDRIHEWL